MTETTPKDKGPWYDHPLWIAIIGSVIVTMSQLFGTIFPIAFGPDLSDYNLISDPIYHSVLFDTKHSWVIDNTTSQVAPNPINEDGKWYEDVVTSRITVANSHKMQHYDREIYLNVESPPGFDSSISNPTIKTGEIVYLNTKVNLTYIVKYGAKSIARTPNSDKYPIIIQGIGADGKKRNCTVVIEVGVVNNFR